MVEHNFRVHFFLGKCVHHNGKEWSETRQGGKSARLEKSIEKLDLLLHAYNH